MIKIVQNTCNIRYYTACKIEEKTKYAGNNIEIHENVKSKWECAKKCANKAAENGKARFWTYNPNKKRCWIKNEKAKEGKKPHQASVSGNVVCGYRYVQGKRAFFFFL